MAMIELNYEQKELVIQEVLMNDFENLSREIAVLSARDDLKEFEQEELEDMTKYRKAMKRLLRYYMARVHADEFIDDVEMQFKVVNND
jgi:siroheme synthase (precorrin-2 oxidase/ferrochelatase)